ncbi:MAG TPA: hypothetical protein VFQ00_03410 [Terriglobales bacterium]|nr:hypothetical protein [Terriglobales bacterium]
MSLEGLLARLVPILEHALATYMITGSVASSVHGSPRSTRDLDIVIAPSREQLLVMMQQFSQSEYYADKEQAMHAFSHPSQFNVIDFATGWKIDFIIAEDSEYGRVAMERRQLSDLGTVSAYFASAEDVLLAKLRWARMGGSDRQLQDAFGIVRTQGPKLDIAYVEHWVRELSLEKQWAAVRE